MPGLRAITVCPTCQTFWDADGPSACADESHVPSHLAREMHVHVDAVTLPDGATVVAATFDDRRPYERDGDPPAFGLYLDDRWDPPWPHARIDWPDFGVPDDRAALQDALRELHARAKAGERVELGCWGGHGRTGTALACLAVLAGVPPEEAVAWVRAAYCAKAVETEEQAAFVASS